MITNHLDLLLVALIVLGASAYIIYLIGRRWFRKKFRGDDSVPAPTCGCSECPTKQKDEG
jgi:hypothetical protein